ncbi:hypothetical protein SEA_GUEY18_19 [Gordonia phage Guey18]|nr:hypothetical protein SEA_GUEY18_19 [Gordonia phage Guey18]
MIWPPFIRRLPQNKKCHLGIHDWGEWVPRDKWTYINQITRDGYRTCKQCNYRKKFRWGGYQQEWLKQHPGWSDAGF